MGKLRCGKFTKLVVNEWQKPLGGGIAVLDREDDLRDVGHEKWPGTSWPDRLIVTGPSLNGADALSHGPSNPSSTVRGWNEARI
jgi:hypothetical protein